MEHLTIKEITRYDKDKEGKPLVTKDNRPYVRVVLEVSEVKYAGKKMSGFENWQTKNLKIGDKVEMEVTQSGDYLNFRFPGKDDRLLKQLEEINGRLVKLNMGVQQILSKLPDKDDYPEFQGEPDFAKPEENIPVF